MTRARHMVERARKTFSVTYMTSLTHARGGVLLSVREGSNNGKDYIDSLADAAYHGHLQNGDILIVDNAKIHGAQEWQEIQDLLLIAVGARVVRLPAYFPEFMPCELVFQNVKRWMRAHRGTGTFYEEILRGFAFATNLIFVARQYRYCIPNL